VEVVLTWEPGGGLTHLIEDPQNPRFIVNLNSLVKMNPESSLWEMDAQRQKSFQRHFQRKLAHQSTVSLKARFEQIVNDQSGVQRFVDKVVPKIPRLSVIGGLAWAAFLLLGSSPGGAWHALSFEWPKLSMKESLFSFAVLIIAPQVQLFTSPVAWQIVALGFALIGGPGLIAYVHKNRSQWGAALQRDREFDEVAIEIELRLTKIRKQLLTSVSDSERLKLIAREANLKVELKNQKKDPERLPLFKIFAYQAGILLSAMLLTGIYSAATAQTGIGTDHALPPAPNHPAHPTLHASAMDIPIPA
jgi:hypothetical protein